MKVLACSCWDVYQLNWQGTGGSSSYKLHFIIETCLKTVKTCVLACVHKCVCMCVHECVCVIIWTFFIVESNILVLEVCSCSIIWECSCLVKYLVRLADFDSIKETLEQVDQRTVPVVRCRVKDSKEYSYLAGTKGYRAPEVSICVNVKTWCFIC